MAGRYEQLTVALLAAAERGQEAVYLDFDEIAALVGALPSSASSRQWWANSSHTQARAWRAAGFHVSWVSLDRRRVRFERGQVGGGQIKGGPLGTGLPKPDTAEPTPAPGAATGVVIGDPVDVRVGIQWTDAGEVLLDDLGRPAFGALPAVPGLYRMTLTGARGQSRPLVYFGESISLARRLAGNYRSPGNGQQTSLRINARLREHLGLGGRVALVIATTATVHVGAADGAPTAQGGLDLSRKSSRLLAENAALVQAQLADAADIENLP